MTPLNDRPVQIDVVHIVDHHVTCNLYTGLRCVRVFMTVYDYDALIRDGFFIRDGKEKDSAGVLNTTLTYIPEPQPAIPDVQA